MNQKPAKVKAEALRLVASGLSRKATAAQISKRFRTQVSASAVDAWVRAAKEAPPPESEPESVPLPAPPPAPPEAAAGASPVVEDLYTQTQGQLATAMQRSREASSDGNHTAAQRYSKQAADLTLLLARLDKDRKVDTDVVSIPRAEFDQADRAARDVLTALRADLARTGGLVCNHCGREIRIALARGE